jgi:O-acetyl-ADP-ribose deacetylase (regulator of RNase III)
LLAFRHAGLTVEIADGDLSAQDVDAVVNAANNHFWMGAGVAGALKASGGPTIETEAMALGPVSPGECVVTSGGRLKARHVIHAAVMGQDLVTSAALIERATRNALAVAEKHGFSSVAFPAFGTGVGGFPLADCATVMIDAIRAHQARSLHLIRLVLFGQAAYQAFAAVAAGRFAGPRPGPPDGPLSA